jgi:NADH dehydrogenase [ubiquinone] 1 alpha subcomplex assembly factor 7
VFGTGASVAAPDVAAAPGTIVETCPAAEALMRDIAGRIVAGGGAALVVDYGPAIAGTGDTLQAVRAHQKVPVLEAPGEADLTAHVDFAGLAAAARAAGAAAFGPLPQGVFLHRLGLAARAAQLLQSATPAQAREIEAAVRRLIEPTEMGTLFKALAVAGANTAAPPGFAA